MTGSSYRRIFVSPTTLFLTRRFRQCTCPADGGDGAERQRPAEAAGERRGRCLALAGALWPIDELGHVGGRAGNEGVGKVHSKQRGLEAAERGRRRAT